MRRTRALDRGAVSRRSVVSWPSVHRSPPACRVRRRHALHLLVEREMILRAAAAIEHDRRRCEAWFRDDPIAELGQLTAAELVRQGAGDRVLHMLRSIRQGLRDG